MNEFSIKLNIRKRMGKEEAKKLRREGIIPGIVYGAGEETIPIKMDNKSLLNLLRKIPSESTVINLDIEGENKMGIIQDMQTHPLYGIPTHVDFRIVHKGETVKVTVPVVLEGVAAGVKEGGLLEQVIYDIDIETTPMNMPEKIVCDVTDMKVGDKIYVKDLEVGEAKILHNLENVIAEVVVPHVHVEEVPEEEVEEEEIQEPEVINEKKEEEKSE
ncbi:50S ribosomal protein L25 [candidate division WOR-3 bacterium]|uniref:Large ribosomal subunit protein bL25 n=1 Tax=candidate division TA06 bacterium TaxID=2250710 RepID=A0A660S5U4_UNCT6|nr:50S ribosomal protein L25 [candidate division WOR-3 bacterium]RKX64949.1 MAG: 50S ribosomal protein L25 [candidate division TA06 bacterium]